MSERIAWTEPDLQIEERDAERAVYWRALRAAVITTIPASVLVGCATYRIGIRDWPAGSWTSVALAIALFLIAMVIIGAMMALQPALERWLGATKKPHRPPGPRDVVLSDVGLQLGQVRYAFNELIDLLVVSANGRRWLRAYAGTPWYERRPVAVALADSVDADAAALLIHRHAGRAIRRLDAREFEPLPRQMAILLLLAVVHGVTVWLLLRMGSIRGTNLMWIGMLASPAYLYGTLAAPRSSTGICGRMIVAFYTSVVAWWVAGLVHIAMGPL